MIRGLIYLTGLFTLTVIAAVAGVTFRVHTWPWGSYIRDARAFLVEKLEPGDGAPADPRDEGPTAAAGPREAPSDEACQATDDRHGLDRAATGPRQVERETKAEPRALRHTVARGETLSALAERYYGNAMRWRRIARANGIRSPRDLQVGKVLVIPARASEERDAADARGGGRFVEMSLAIWPAGERETPGPKTSAERGAP